MRKEKIMNLNNLIGLLIAAVLVILLVWAVMQVLD